MSRYGPFTPAFDAKKRRGTVYTGVAVGEPPAITFEEVYRIDTGGLADDVCFIGNTAFVLGWVSASNHQLVSVDISDPANLSIIQSFTSASITGPWSCDSSATHVFVLCDDGFLVAINATNPASMSVVDAIDCGSLPRCVVVDAGNDVAYVSTTNLISAVDISDPTNLSILGTQALTGVWSMVLSDDHNWLIAQGSSGLVSYDISTPGTFGSGSTLAVLSTGSDAGIRAFAVSGDVLVGAKDDGGTGSAGIVVSVDLSSLPTMTQLDSLDTSDSADLTDVNSVAIIGSHAYALSDNMEHLVAIDISNPASMTVESSPSPAGIPITGSMTSYSVRARDAYLYVALEESNPTLIVVHTTYP